MRELWLATGNAKKRAELERLLAPLGVALRQPGELPGELPAELPAALPVPFAPVEDQPDFAGNARVKASALARLAHGVALADDSGLCVDALGGRPGVHSARYGGPGLSDRERLERLLLELATVPPPARTAHFMCSLCLCGADGEVRFAVEERCEGVLLARASGSGGFGYDPIFVPREFAGQPDPPTFATLDAATKDRLSHRGKALRAFAAALRARPGLLAP
jgi:XTP/dITP diphosphohydrolase